LQFDPPQEVTGDSMPSRRRVLGPAGKKKGSLPPIEARTNAEDYLHELLPPREWEENGRRFV
jgi:hypothetical protein